MKETFKFANIIFEPTADSSVYFLQITDGEAIRRYVTVLTFEAQAHIEALAKAGYKSEDIQTLGFLSFLKDFDCVVIAMKEQFLHGDTDVLESYPLTKYTNIYLKKFSIRLGDDEYEVKNAKEVFEAIKKSAKNKAEAKSIITSLVQREKQLSGVDEDYI